MDYRFDEAEESFRAEIRRFTAKSLAPHYQSDDRAARFRRSLVIDLAGVGLTGLRIPEQYGGQAASAVVAGIAAEEVGRADVNASYVLINTGLISDIPRAQRHGGAEAGVAARHRQRRHPAVHLRH